MKRITEKKYTFLSTLSRYSFIGVLAFALLVPIVFVQAKCGDPGQPACVPAGSDNTGKPPAGSDNTNPGGTKVDTKIQNPLGSSITDIPSFIETIVNFVLIVGVPIVALAIIYSGFLFVAARGNPEELSKAKKTLMYTLIGAALLLGAFVIAKAIMGTVEDIKKTT